MSNASSGDAAFGGYGAMRPTQIRARTMEALQEVAATVGIPARIVKKVAEVAETKPIDGLGGWMQRVLAKLSENGVIGEVPPDVLSWLSPERVMSAGSQAEDVIAEADDDLYSSDDLSQIMQVLAQHEAMGQDGADQLGAMEGQPGAPVEQLPVDAQAGQPAAQAPEGAASEGVGAGGAAGVPGAGPTTALEAFGVAGQPINRDWVMFTPETGTLGIPREQMPQVDAAHRGALVQFLRSRGVSATIEEVAPESLKPAQAEFSLRKVRQAMTYAGGDRAILVSQDDYIIDGTHQWLAKLESGQPTKVLRLGAPIQDLLRLTHQFPSSRPATGPRRLPTNQGSPDGRLADAGGVAPVGPADGAAGVGVASLVQSQQPGSAAAGPSGDAGPGVAQGSGAAQPGPVASDSALTAPPPEAGLTFTAPDGRLLTIMSASPYRVTVADENGARMSIAKGSNGWAQMEVQLSQPNPEPAPQAAPAVGPASQAPQPMQAQQPPQMAQPAPRHPSEVPEMPAPMQGAMMAADMQAGATGGRSAGAMMQNNGAPVVTEADLGNVKVGIMDPGGGLSDETKTLDEVMADVVDLESDKQPELRDGDQVMLLGEVYKVLNVQRRGAVLRGKDGKRKFIKRGTVNWVRMMILRPPEKKKAEAPADEMATDAMAD